MLEIPGIYRCVTATGIYYVYQYEYKYTATSPSLNEIPTIADFSLSLCSYNVQVSQVTAAAVLSEHVCPLYLLDNVIGQLFTLSVVSTNQIAYISSRQTGQGAAIPF